MPPDAESDQKSLIQANRLLLVEGKDEVNLLGKLIKDCLKDDEQGIQILDVGSKDNFRAELGGDSDGCPNLEPALCLNGRIVRDADKCAKGSFQSVYDSVRAVGYKPPDAHAEFSNATPSIGVFIVPDGSQPGAIETLCRRSVAGKAAAKCVDDYMECLTTNNALKSKNLDKTFTHAYLAATKDPVARVGEGARQKVWDFQSPAFDALSQFVRDLSLPG